MPGAIFIFREHDSVVQITLLWPSDVSAPLALLSSGTRESAKV